MEMTDFIFNCRQINSSTFESILTNKEGTTFGCNYQSRICAPHEFIWNEFVKNKSQFFIDIPAEIIKEEIKSEVIVTPTKKVEGVVNSEI